MTYPQLPDATQALIEFLTNYTALATVHGGRVGTRVQSDLACLQVTPLGGPQPWPWESTPEFSISSWGAKSAIDADGQASDLDRAVRAAVYELTGQPVAGGRVVSVAIRLAGLWSPAEDTGRARVRSDVALTVLP